MRGRRAARVLLFGGFVLLLTAGQRPGSCNSGGGCGSGNGCSADLAPRTIQFLPSGDASKSNFHFLLGTSTAVTGQAAIAPDLYTTATAETAETTLDSNSDAFIFDGDSSLPNGMRGPLFFDLEGWPLPNWAHLPYTYADNGPAQTVPLKDAWPRTIQTVRLLDHGYCVARVAYSAMVDQLAAALVGKLNSCPNDVGRVFVELTPLFRSKPADPSAPVTGAPVQDQLIWDIQIDATFYTGAGSDCSIRLNANLDTRLVHGLNVVNAERGTRLALPNFQLLTGHDIAGKGGRPPGTVEGPINDQLRSDVPKQFMYTVLNGFTIPRPTGAALVKWQQGKLVYLTDDLAPQFCKTDAECQNGTSGGPEDICFHPNDNESLSPFLVAGQVNDDLRKKNQGVCIWRLEPKRINIRPTGIDIVVVDNTTDPQFSTVQTLAALQPGGALTCSAPLAKPIDPLGPDAVGQLNPYRRLRSLPP